MRRALRFLAPLAIVLGLLAWAASAIVDATTQRWFAKDMSLRAELAINGAREALVVHWRSGASDRVRGVLDAITRDERIMSASACSTDLELVAATSDFPARFGCAAIASHVRLAAPHAGRTWDWKTWDEVTELRGGRAHVSAIPIFDEDRALGFVVLVHDMSYVDRRESATRWFSLAAFAVLALAASIVTILVARFSWRSWTFQMRRVLRGNVGNRDFQPILGEIRELAARLASESHADAAGAPWSPDRLRQTLRRHLHGESLIVVANREPYIHERSGGAVRVIHPASGLVTALEPIMRACSGVWVAHGSGSADRDVVDRKGRVRVPPGEESYAIRRVWLSTEEEQGYYYGLSNEGLWPLCHIAHARPTFRTGDWAQYQRVNQRFAEAACAEAVNEDPIVFVQDYHFALAPRMIRERRPRATILTFWHIPWPNSERFGICPWNRDILEGMLGSSIVGFHTQAHCNNFLDAVDQFLEARIDREQQAVIYGGRPTLVRPYPISIEWPNHWVESAPSVAECRATVLADLGAPRDALIAVGVDRLDYTKGIEERLLAVERLLERFPHLRGRFTFIQLAAPSRSIIQRYQELDRSVEATVARINVRFGRGVYRPIVLRREHHEPPAVFRYYRAADVCYVSSLHDGMNLVAKEFVAARDDERGVLVLSRFTGAAREMTEALLVNPYDLDEASSALAQALSMADDEQQERMAAMRSLLREFNVYRWAGRMLVDAARLRQRDRLSGRLLESVRRAEGAVA